MKQVMCVRFDPHPASTIKLREVDRPRPEADEVLIEMVASPINPADLLPLTGRHFYKPTLPAPVGIEGAG